jgi:hypothetical protein
MNRDDVPSQHSALISLLLSLFSLVVRANIVQFLCNTICYHVIDLIRNNHRYL